MSGRATTSSYLMFRRVNVTIVLPRHGELCRLQVSIVLTQPCCTMSVFPSAIDVGNATGDGSGWPRRACASSRGGAGGASRRGWCTVHVTAVLLPELQTRHYA